MKRATRAVVAAALVAAGPFLWIGASCAHCGPIGAGVSADGHVAGHPGNAHVAAADDTRDAADHSQSHSGKAGCDHSAAACCCTAADGQVAGALTLPWFAVNGGTAQALPAAPATDGHRFPTAYARPPPSYA